MCIRDSWWIAKQLAEKLGIGACMPFKDMEEYLAYRIENSGYSWAAFKREGVIMGAKKPITVEDGRALEFDTPSKKVEFWSDQLAKAGFDPVPKYTKHLDAPAGHFRLITGRAPGQTFSRTHTNPLPYDLLPDNEGGVNTATAAKLGLAGSVANTPDGLLLELEGSAADLKAFFHEFRNALPAGADIDESRWESIAPRGVGGFEIGESDAGGARGVAR